MESFLSHVCVRYVFLIWVILEIWILGGLMYGWGALVFVLKDEGFFEEDCAIHIVNGTTGNCIERDETFTLYFSLITAIGTISTLFIGWLLRTYGTRKARILTSTGLIVGCILMAFAEKESTWLLCIGGILVMTSGFALYVTSLQIIVLFPTRTSLVIGLLNGTYDSSSAVFLLVKALYSTYDISRKVSFIALACLAISTVISTFAFFPKMHLDKTLSKNQDSNSDTKETSMKANTAKAHDTVSELGNTTEPQPISFIHRIFSSLYCTYLIWFAFGYFRYIYFIGTLNNTLERLTDENKDAVSYYTNVVAIAMFCGVVLSALAGYGYDLQRRLFRSVVDAYRRYQLSAIIPLAVTSMLATILSILAFVNSEMIIYPSAITVVLLRALLFSVMTVYIADTFPARDLGLLVPIGIVVGIVFGILQYAFFRWSNSYDGADLHVNIAITVMCIISFIHPINVYIRARRQQGSDHNQSYVNSDVSKNATNDTDNSDDIQMPPDIDSMKNIYKRRTSWAYGGVSITD